MSNYIVGDDGAVEVWVDECITENCTKPVHPMSGIHGWCKNCYAKWYNHYAKAYNFPLAEVEDESDGGKNG